MNDQLPLAFDAPVPKHWRESAVKSFHVRSHQRADEVLAGDAQAQRQEEAILQHFRMQDAAVPGVRFTPSEVWRAFEERWPLTSVRRAMTNLTDPRRYSPAPLIHYAGHRRQGVYGKPESCWGLA